MFQTHITSYVAIRKSKRQAGKIVLNYNYISSNWQYILVLWFPKGKQDFDTIPQRVATQTAVEVAGLFSIFYWFFYSKARHYIMYHIKYCTRPMSDSFLRLLFRYKKSNDWLWKHDNGRLERPNKYAKWGRPLLFTSATCLSPGSYLTCLFKVII